MHKLLFLILGFYMSTFTVKSTAQTIPTCQDAYVHEKVVSTNNKYEEQGYKLFYTRELFVPSGGYQPVTVDLNAGQMYIINFVPFLDATKLQLVILDKDNNTIVKKKGKANEILTHSFVPSYTGVYYIIISQKMKKTTELCGGVSILTK